MLMHVGSRCVLTLILIAAGWRFRPSNTRRPHRWRTHYQKFRLITWPSLRTLYVTSLILSMIWTLGDFTAFIC